MKIVLASTSEVKIEACRKAFAAIDEAEIIPLSVPSGVHEQPMGDETLTGAFNRIQAAEQAIPDADLYVSIENGIFQEDGNYIDRAAIVIKRPSEEPRVTFSEGVLFPREAVEEAARRGFDQWTAGQILQEQGLVEHSYDPHTGLSGKSRTDYINEAMTQAVTNLGLQP